MYIVRSVFIIKKTPLFNSLFINETIIKSHLFTPQWFFENKKADNPQITDKQIIRSG